MTTKLYYAWRSQWKKASFSAGVSLHSHTWRSHESLAFLPGAVEGVYPLVRIMKWAERRYKRKWNEPFDYARGYWTSPVTSEEAYALEARQITLAGLRPFVSLTDHDEIAACEELAAPSKGQADRVPVSLEWTLPYKSAVFHIGVHNIPQSESRELLREFRSFTSTPENHGPLADIFTRLNAFPDALIILNHPLSDQGRIGHEIHASLVEDFLKNNGQWIHALEINALQPWNMNRRVAAIAKKTGLPLIAGGDRHGFEPNGAINLTNTASFAEFAHEIRREKKSVILFMPQARGSLALRYSESVSAIMGTYPKLTGRVHWPERVFYECPDGVTRPFSELIGDRFYALDITSLIVKVLGAASRLLKPFSPVFTIPRRALTKTVSEVTSATLPHAHVSARDTAL